MTILDEMEADARAVIERWDTPAWKDVEPTGHVINRLRVTLREYESLKGQIAVVPVQTSEAREAALQWFNGRLEFFSAKHPQQIPYIKTIEAALQQPDTSEAVRVLVKALRGVAKYEKQLSHLGYGAEAVDARQALEDPAVIAAMKGVDHEKVI